MYESIPYEVKESNIVIMYWQLCSQLFKSFKKVFLIQNFFILFQKKCQVLVSMTLVLTTSSFNMPQSLVNYVSPLIYFLQVTLGILINILCRIKYREKYNN